MDVNINTPLFTATDHVTRRVDPGLSFDVPVWDAPNGRCDEEFMIKK